MVTYVYVSDEKVTHVFIGDPGGIAVKKIHLYAANVIVLFIHLLRRCNNWIKDRNKYAIVVEIIFNFKEKEKWQRNSCLLACAHEQICECADYIYTLIKPHEN